MKVIVQRVSADPEVAAKEKPKEDLLLQDTIKVLPARSQMGFIFIFKVDFQANYFMIIETDYTSPLLTEQLKRVIGSYPDLDQRSLQSNQFEIDYQRKTVVRKFNKKYKFEAQLPFEVKKSISLKNNQFLLQIKIKNLSVNKIFLERVLFHCANPQLLKVVDLNNQDLHKSLPSSQEGSNASAVSIFQDSIVFNPSEVRQYLFLVAHATGHSAAKINKFESHHLGQLEIRWVNYLGDPGLLKIGPFKSTGEGLVKGGGPAAPRYEVDLDVIASPEEQLLRLEEPKTVKFRLHNMSQAPMKILLSVREKEVGDLLICGISKYSLGRLEPQATVDFSLDLFPKSCGVHPVSGLLIKDTIGGREWIFKNIGEFLVEYE